MISGAIYHLVAGAATVAYLVFVGLATLFVLSARSPAIEAAVIALKVVAAGLFLIGFGACLYLWLERRWGVVAIPILGFAAQLLVNWIGRAVLQWGGPPYPLFV